VDITTWDWPAWLLALALVGVVGWFVWRWLSALAFRHVLLGGAMRRYGWQADLPGGDGGRTAFREQERRRRKRAWSLLRQGKMREGYRDGTFGRAQSGAWHPVLTITGTWRGHAFVASESRRFELTSSSEGTRQKVRRRASVRLTAPCPPLDARIGTLTGRTRGGPLPPAVADLLRGKRFRFRGFTSDGAGLSMELGPRLRRGRLVAALEYLTEAARRLG
jgi:hypothetical protein